MKNKGIAKGDIVKSLKNPMNLKYEVVKTHKTTCWVIVAAVNETKIYKTVPYSILEKI